MSLQLETISTKKFKRVGIATDHGGFGLKEFLTRKLRDAILKSSGDFQIL